MTVRRYWALSPFPDGFEGKIIVLSVTRFENKLPPVAKLKQLLHKAISTKLILLPELEGTCRSTPNCLSFFSLRRRCTVEAGLKGDTEWLFSVAIRRQLCSRIV